MFFRDRPTHKQNYTVDVVAERRQTFRVRATSREDAERTAATVADFGWQGTNEGFAVISSSVVEVE